MMRIEEALCRPIADTPRTRRYQELLDRSVEEKLPQFDTERGLWLPTGTPAVWTEEEVRGWDDDTIRRISRDARWRFHYEQERATPAHLARMAFCYARPASRRHGDARLLDLVRRGLRSYASAQTDHGSFVNCPMRFAETWGSHEMAWRLEPWVCARAWLGDRLPEEDRRIADAMIRRAAAYLYSHPNTDPNNRGAVWSAVMALCALYLREESYLRAARENWRRIAPAILQAGTVVEDLGPDSNYSYTGFSYVYLYRALSGDDAYDAEMVRALQWFGRWRTRSGYALEGMSSRVRRIGMNRLADLLGAWERFAVVEPYFGVLAGESLDTMRAHGAELNGGHCTDMRIWAMMEHRPDVPPPAEEPAWHREYGHEYKTPGCLYSLVRRGYQTAVTLYASQGMKGLQTWAWGDEPPILLAGAARDVSATRAWALDTAEMAVGKGVATSPWYDRLWDRRREPWTYSYRQSFLWTHLLFTPESVVALISGRTGPRVTTWCSNRKAAPEPRVEAGFVRFGDLRGRLAFVGTEPVLRPGTDEGARLLLFERDELVTPFALCNERFRFLETTPEGRTLFEDATGRYEARIETRGERQTLAAERLSA